MLEYNENTQSYELLDEQGYDTIGYMTLDALVRQLELAELHYEVVL